MSSDLIKIITPNDHPELPLSHTWVIIRGCIFKDFVESMQQPGSVVTCWTDSLANLGYLKCVGTVFMGCEAETGGAIRTNVDNTSISTSCFMNCRGSKYGTALFMDCLTGNPFMLSESTFFYCRTYRLSGGAACYIGGYDCGIRVNNFTACKGNRATGDLMVRDVNYCVLQFCVLQNTTGPAVISSYRSKDLAITRSALIGCRVSDTLIHYSSLRVGGRFIYRFTSFIDNKLTETIRNPDIPDTDVLAMIVMDNCYSDDDSAIALFQGRSHFQESVTEERKSPSTLGQMPANPSCLVQIGGWIPKDTYNLTPIIIMSLIAVIILVGISVMIGYVILKRRRNRSWVEAQVMNSAADFDDDFD